MKVFYRILCLSLGIILCSNANAQSTEPKQAKHTQVVTLGPSSFGLIPKGAYAEYEYAFKAKWAIRGGIRYSTGRDSINNLIQIPEHLKFQVQARLYPNFGPRQFFMMAYTDLYLPKAAALGLGFGYNFFFNKRFGLQTGFSVFSSNAVETGDTDMQFRLHLGLNYALTPLYDRFF